MIKFLISQLHDVIKEPDFIQELKKYIGHGKILFVPSDVSREDITMVYGNGIIKDFNNRDFNFTKVDYLNMDNYKSIESHINEYSIIFLMGGVTLTQNRFLKEVNFKNMISNYKGIIIGQSAGALNMCKDVYFPDEEGEGEYLKGLALVDIVVDVHFEEKNKRYIKKKNIETYCITNEGAILIRDDIKIIGDVYLYDGKEFISCK